ncbi:ABC transporter ATP-binding protein [Pseudonocardia humida]|uniref:ABC transporter ATP-binding protein n=1 Tax=Pseudonocardia humida TaxID=2800819 RepID=A0ABT1A2B2_9PSEU|nr:ABC transporter ATP-binding protein [Pseudonocardia humida]MCO1657078.1 ABC transporter ATP-binding protein [Pseudonocardia humida]
MGPALEVAGLTVRRGRSEVVREVDLVVGEGECVCLVGSNGAGKTSLIDGLLGVLPTRAERLEFHGEDIAGTPPWERVRRGLVVVPQERELFPGLSVLDNLELGGVALSRGKARAGTLDDVLALFPRLAERRAQPAGTLSGGERSMLAVGRGLMAQPRMLVLDEPSLGLAPMVVTTIMAAIAEVNAAGTTVLLVEQNVHQAFALADRAYVLEHGAVVGSGPTAELAGSDLMQHGFLGSAAHGTVVDT